MDPARVMQLEGQLGQLAPELAAVAVTLRASVLPSLALLNQRAAAAVEVSSDASRLGCETARGGDGLGAVLPSGTVGLLTGEALSAF